MVEKEVAVLIVLVRRHRCFSIAISIFDSKPPATVDLVATHRHRQTSIVSYRNPPSVHTHAATRSLKSHPQVPPPDPPAKPGARVGRYWLLEVQLGGPCSPSLRFCCCCQMSKFSRRDAGAMPSLSPPLLLWHLSLARARLAPRKPLRRSHAKNVTHRKECARTGCAWRAGRRQAAGWAARGCRPRRRGRGTWRRQTRPRRERRPCPRR